MVKNTILYTSRNPKRVRKNVEITRKPGIITTRTGPSVYRLLSSSSLPQACCGLVVNYLYPVSQDSQHLVLTLIITVTHEKKREKKILILFLDQSAAEIKTTNHQIFLEVDQKHRLDQACASPCKCKSENHKPAPVKGLLGAT